MFLPKVIAPLAEPLFHHWFLCSRRTRWTHGRRLHCRKWMANSTTSSSNNNSSRWTAKITGVTYARVYIPAPKWNGWVPVRKVWTLTPCISLVWEVLSEHRKTVVLIHMAACWVARGVWIIWRNSGICLRLNGSHWKGEGRCAALENEKLIMTPWRGFHEFLWRMIG